MRLRKSVPITGLPPTNIVAAARQLFEHGCRPAQAPLAKGEVALVGAGPGDPGLLTQAAMDLLAQCDAVAYDALIPPEILALLPAHAHKYDVGKRGPGAPPTDARSTPQAAILALLTKLARQKKRVVRLKGGDPFVFGRGGEEVDGLRKAGVKFRCVPGLTAGLGALSALGIPMTDRRYSGSVTLVSAHRAPTAGGGGKIPPISPADFDFWAACVRHGTLIVYMGVGRLPTIATALAKRLPKTTPALVIQEATRAEQVVVYGQLRNIAVRAAAAKIASPAILVFGTAVRA
ncbi:MAG TPA: uroporphyrinogen-III C-methyltransferase [Planctomycetota bacterium]|nr:uroporphyrinogen-III C-methyltransferase [Planctomycetota bacterium]